MANLTPRLTLTGTAASFGSAVNLSVDDTLVVGAPFSGVSRISISTSIQDISTDLKTTQAEISFVYLKNTDSSNVITVATGGDVLFADLNPGEFMFFPLKGTVGLKAKANSAPCILEYAYFSRT
tara:strand:- start:93 stop:464 length:372 start_codon:yes stop_codon:yes gene_type:complete